jgi:hypothetical protein
MAVRQFTRSVMAQQVHAVVSRGGWPDLAGQSVLGKVTSPTLLQVASFDEEVLTLPRLRYANCRPSTTSMDSAL